MSQELHLAAFSPTAFDWALVTYLVALIPFLVYRKIQRTRRRVAAADPEARVHLYRRGIAEQWIVSAILLFGWWRLARPLDGLGLGWPVDGRALAAWALCLVGVALLALQMRGIAQSESAREQLRAQIGSANNELGDLTPTNKRELGWFAGISFTAGINEELVYRGFLMALFAALGGPVLAVVGSVAVFTVGHAYQPHHVHRVALVGLVMSLLYLLGGTLWPLMLLHAAIDLSSGWMTWRVNQAEDDNFGGMEALPASS